MTNKTYLDTSDGMAAYAKRHGAKYDAERGEWYVEGEVPNALIGLIPKKPNPSHHTVAPTCRICGSYMVLRARKRDRNLFWGCSGRPKCYGVVSLEEHLESEDPRGAKLATDYLAPSAPAAKKSPSFLNKPWKSWPSDVKLAVQRVCKLAEKRCRGQYRAREWLFSRKDALQGMAPVEVMNSVAGCELVEKLLRKR